VVLPNILAWPANKEPPYPPLSQRILRGVAGVEEAYLLS
jgi:hypothetical protein